MLQGFFGFVLGGVVIAILLATEPQLVGDVQYGLHDLRLGARQLMSDRNDTRVSSDRRYDDRGDDRDRNGRDDRSDRDRYDNGRDPTGSGDRAPPPGDNSPSP